MLTQSLPPSTLQCFLRSRLAALLLPAATTRRAELLRGASIIICTLGPPSARLQGEHTCKGDAADEVARCESERWGAQVGRELGTRVVGWERDIVGEYACDGASTRDVSVRLVRA